MARGSHRLDGQGGSIEPEGAGLGPWSGQSPVRAAVFDAGYRFLMRLLYANAPVEHTIPESWMKMFDLAWYLEWEEGEGAPT